MKDKIEKILNKVKPFIKAHGGDVALIKVERDIVFLKIEGSCKHCPLADLTYNKLVTGLIKENIPEIKEVIFENFNRDNSSDKK